MSTLTIVNMIPRSLSGETEQDSESSITVDPENTQHIVATAFTPDPAAGPRAPIFVSTDGGATWSLRTVVPGGMATSDISVAFASQGGALYAGILNYSNFALNILRTTNPFGTATMKKLVERPDEDQPWVTAITTANHDHVYVSHNNFNTLPRTATVELSMNARTAPAPAGFTPRVIERRDTLGQDGPPVRTAVHPSGVVYAAAHRWREVVRQTSSSADIKFDVVVSRDDDWGKGEHPFTDLKDPDDNHSGLRVARGRLTHFTASIGPLGQERIGADLAIAVDPTDATHVWLAWCDRVGGVTGTDWTLHVRHSTDSGATWSGDVRAATNSKNPSLAVNDQGLVGLLFQQVVGAGAARRWNTRIELTDDAWATPATRHIIHAASATQPPRTFLPYLGDYIRMVCVGPEFFGAFCGSNLPDMANFPHGVTYQRNADWSSHTLLRVDNVTPVAVSIDPFFVHYVP